MQTDARRLIVAMTGASGAIYGVRLLKLLKSWPDVETHLVISDAAATTLRHEMDMRADQVALLADRTYRFDDLGAAIASGSFSSMGMIVAPCSVNTLAAVANGFCQNLITRAADVVLKERRRLVLMVRETPLNMAHVRNMQYVTEMGGIIYPPVPAFYARPASIEEMVDHTLLRVLDLYGLCAQSTYRWEGIL